jgi:hypothetical protein
VETGLRGDIWLVLLKIPFTYRALRHARVMGSVGNLFDDPMDNEDAPSERTRAAGRTDPIGPEKAARARADKAVKEADERARARAAVLLMPIVDDLAIALSSCADLDDAFALGVRIVHERALQALERLGALQFGEVGDQFDPMFHEAVSTDPTAARNVISIVMRSGYRSGDRLIRAALVVVGE